MKAMILAAGGGTRLQPLTFTLPKPLVPVLNRPVMEHILKHLIKCGIDEFIVNLNYMPDTITDYFGNGDKWNTKITYSLEETPMGTAGGVKKAGEFLKSDTFLVIGGDDLTDIDITEVVKFHREKGAIATIALYPVENPSLFGIVKTDEHGRIQMFQEKPDLDKAVSNLANTGIYIFEPEILDLIPDGEIYDFGCQLFPRLQEEGYPFFGCLVEGYWRDIGNLEDYRISQFDALEGKVNVDKPGNEMITGVWIGNDSYIHPDSIINPPVLIGNNCLVEPDTTIGDNVVLGNNCIIEKNSSIKKSLVWNGVIIKENNIVIDSIVGDSCVLDGGGNYCSEVLCREE
ncbi:MAG: NDP-sugar synthase [Candidatus Eremiobacteraeota bacterium]|nr:NDP-sugar synthase [Candidatus Eremiobacteraeota bacterium]